MPNIPSDIETDDDDDLDNPFLASSSSSDNSPGPKKTLGVDPKLSSSTPSVKDTSIRSRATGPLPRNIGIGDGDVECSSKITKRLSMDSSSLLDNGSHKMLPGIAPSSPFSRRRQSIILKDATTVPVSPKMSGEESSLNRKSSMSTLLNKKRFSFSNRDRSSKGKNTFGSLSSSSLFLDSFDDLSQPFRQQNQSMDRNQLSIHSSTVNYTYETGGEELSTFEVLKQEIAQLKLEKQQLEKTIADKGKVQDVSITLSNLWQNKHYLLEPHKSLEHKLDLLDAAIQQYDGDSIVCIVLFLKNTLVERIFMSIFEERPIALVHYKAFLRSRGKWKALSELYQELGEHKESVMLLYRTVETLTDVNEKMIVLQQCVELCEEYGGMDFEKEMIHDHWSLLVRQVPIEKHDSHLEELGKDKFLKTFPRTRSLIDRTVIDTLYYSLFYHYMAPEDRLSSPVAICKEFKITPLQYQWTAVEARSKLNDWKAIEKLFSRSNAPKSKTNQIKSMFKEETKLDVLMGHENAILLLYRNKCPMVLMNVLFSDLTLSEKADNTIFELAARVGCLMALVKCFSEREQATKLKDLKTWIAYSIPPKDVPAFIKQIDEVILDIES